MAEDKDEALTATTHDVGDGHVTYVNKDVMILGHDVDLPAERRQNIEVAFGVDDIPPWYMVIILACQHYIVTIVSTFTTPFFFAEAMCLSLDNPDINDVVNAIFFISGISTLLQTSIGVRLGIIQGTSFAFLLPMLAMLSQPQWKCPDEAEYRNMTMMSNDSIPYEDIWKSRMQEVSGTIMVASVFQMLIGFSGILEGMLRYIGPITIAPVIAIIGLALFQVAADMCSLQWGISMLTVLLITIFVLLMKRVTVPYMVCGTSNCMKKSEEAPEKDSVDAQNRLNQRIPIFSMFSFIIAMLLIWLLCYILTVTNALSSEPGEMGYEARTDLRTKALRETPWFRVPTPFQFGLPTVSAAGILGMLAATMSSVIESVGDYYAAARVSGAPPPPKHAINRGIFMEGVACMLSGMFGCGIGSTSYSQNIAVLSITKVGTRRVVQICGAITLVLALLGKFAALFVTIPLPVVGGIFMVMFGMIAAVGLSNLHYVDIKSPRNMYILGLSILMGLAIPAYLNRNPEYIQSGYPILDQICTVLLSTGMFVAGAIALTLDNLTPGTPEERGIIFWNQISEGDDGEITAPISTYDIPYISKLLDKCPCTQYIPVCHNFSGYHCRKNRHRTNATSEEATEF